jgi:hypothetical protein
MKWYLVKADLKFPPCDDKGAEFILWAKNKVDAIKQARREVRIECLYGRPDGPLIYSATETNSPYDEYQDDQEKEPLVFLPHPLETDYPLY